MKCSLCSKKAVWIRLKTKKGPKGLCDHCLDEQPDKINLLDNYVFER
jgi:hypothetical protein